MDRLKDINVLFVEDNEEFARNTIAFLELYFHKVFHADNIQDALQKYEKEKIGFVLCDIKLREENGLNFIEKVRLKDAKTPIAILSAHKDEDFLLKAIPLNIMSYEIKPLNYEEYIVMFEKLLKRLFSSERIKFSENIEYDSAHKELRKNSEKIKLSKKEILFIELMLQHKEKIVTKEMIQNFVWKNDMMSDSALKNMVFRLRKKISKEWLITLSDIGYKFNATSCGGE